MKKVNTIIIGGGIAGLACARKLTDNNRDFILITENIGGRIMSSEDGRVNYGAYFVGEDYKHILPYIKKGKRLSRFDLTFHRKKIKYNILGILFYPLQLIRLIKEIYKFKSHYKKLKQEMLLISSKEAIERDPYLFKLFNTRADNLIKELKISDITEKYINEVMYGILFLKPDGYYGLDFMRWVQYLLVPIYDFSFIKEKIITGYENKIINGLVEKITFKTSEYIIRTKNKQEYLANNVVVATPITVSQKLLNLPEIRSSVNAHSFHVNGKIKNKRGNEKFDVFSVGSRIIDIAYEGENDYLLYSKDEKPNFDKFFSSYEIIHHVFWEPAFSMNGTVLLDANQGPNLYLAGEYNLTGMEDAFISGTYVANKILGRTKD